MAGALRNTREALAVLIINRQPSGSPACRWPWCGLIALIFGVYPALKAAATDPARALQGAES